MTTLYHFILYIHILSVIISIGPFFAVIPILSKLKNLEGHEQQNIYLDTFRFVVRLTKHAGHVLVASGALLVLLGSWSWKTPWILTTLLVMASSLFFLARAFSPSIRKLADHTQNREQAIQTLTRSTWLYIILLLIILWMMVSKPLFW